ncbi:MAG: urea carboxylase-associated family protein, partial [Desulfobacterales bacterium]
MIGLPLPKLNMNIIPAKKYTALTLKAGQFLSLIDLKGGQVADLTAFRLHDSSEWLSNGRSFDYGGTLYFTTGDTLFSNKSNPMLSIVADDVGRHDFLYAACSKEMYRIQYG